MLFLTKLHLENYCQYTNQTFDFTKPDGNPYKYVCFFGPNGIGKSNLLEAISLLSMNHTGRDPEHVRRSLRKYVNNQDYNPSYERISGHTYDKDYAVEYKDTLPNMAIEGTYEMDGKSYIVRLTQDGFVRNDLAPTEVSEGPWGDDHLLYRQRIAHFITADNDLSLSKFQLHKDKMKAFEELTSKVMRFPTECVKPSGVVPIDHAYCTDFIIYKIISKQEYRTHYKRMSAGEQKISKLFSQLLNLIYDLEHPDPGEPVMEGWPRLLLVDNIEMHIYYDRHVTMIECMKEHFSDQQIFATTHSGILIERFLKGENDQENELMVNLETI